MNAGGRSLSGTGYRHTGSLGQLAAGAMAGGSLRVSAGFWHHGYGLGSEVALPEAVASGGAIHPGDLLVTSGRAGHAMKATDHSLMLGAVLGRAMTGLESGTGLALVLVSLQ